jgi:hypothetical protein
MSDAAFTLLALPEVYALAVMGDSLEPDFHDGTCLVFSTIEPLEKGDLVVAYFRPGAQSSCGDTKAIFRLSMAIMPGVTFPFVDAPTSEVHPLVYLETVNAPQRRQFRADAFLALHKAIGTCQPDGGKAVYFCEQETAEGEVA